MEQKYNFDLLPNDHPLVLESLKRFSLEMDGSHAFTLSDDTGTPLAIAMVTLNGNQDIKINFLAADKQRPKEGFATELLTCIFPILHKNQILSERLVLL